jgi:hypothetical protein
MKSVQELNQDQLDNLKFNYLYEVDNDYQYYSDIPNEVIFEHYAHISFVDEDFN